MTNKITFADQLKALRKNGDIANIMSFLTNRAPQIEAVVRAAQDAVSKKKFRLDTLERSLVALNKERS